MNRTLAPSPPLDLAPRHARRLAALHGASRETIAETVALWPLGSRLLLWVYNAIDYEQGQDRSSSGEPLTRDEIIEAADSGVPLDFGVTDFGLQLVADCARWRMRNEPDEARSDNASALDPHAGWPESLASHDDLNIDPADVEEA
jgi:hypothetical protein